MVLQALASLALLRLLRVLLGDRPFLLVPLAVGLFTPVTLGFLSWWTAALNSLPLQIGLAWFLADAVRLSRTGRRRYAISGTVALALALLFYVKAALIPGIGFVLVAIVLRRDGESSPLVATWQRARALWTGSSVVVACWAVTYLFTRRDAPVRSDPGEVVASISSSFEVLTPMVLGGPVRWYMFVQSTPVADLPNWSVLLGAVVLLAAALWTSASLRGAPAVWGLVLGTVVVGIVMAGIGRSLTGYGAALPLAARYFAVEAVLLPLAIALLASLPARTGAGGAEDGSGTGRSLRPAWAAPLTALLTAVFVAVSLSSTFSHVDAWDDNRTEAYLDTARASLAAAGPAPLLDQPLPQDVMWGLFQPYNMASRAFGPLRDRPEFAASTTDPRMLDEDGNLRPPTSPASPSPTGRSRAAGGRSPRAPGPPWR
jgi:hypothetical protein